MDDEVKKIVEEVAEEKDVNLENTLLIEHKAQRLYEQRGEKALRTSLETAFASIKAAEQGDDKK